MYLCLCQGITEKEARRSLEEEPLCFEEWVQENGASLDCGSCVFRIRRFYDEVTRNQPQPKQTKAS